MVGRAAPPPVAARGAHGGNPLTRQAFQSIYHAELKQGKFWGVEHDLRVLRGSGLAQPGAPPFQARFDNLFFSSNSLRLEVVQEPLPVERRDHRWPVLPL